MKAIVLALMGILLGGRASAKSPEAPQVVPHVEVPDAEAVGVNSILRYIPKTQWAAIRTCKSTYDVRTAEARAETAISINPSGFVYPQAGEIDWPAGCYYFAGPLSIKHSVIERGVGQGQVLDSATIWMFPANSLGVVIDHSNTTLGRRISPPTTSGAGTLIDAIEIKGSSSLDSSNIPNSPDTTSHGVWCVARCELRDVNVTRFAGDCVHIVANGGVGNANDFRVEGGIFEFCGRYGFYAQGSDANAGMTIGMDIAYTGGAGLYDFSFLGNTHEAPEVAESNRGLTEASYAGKTYLCLKPTCAATTPGTNNFTWYDLGAEAQAPAFNPANPYVVGGAIVANGANGRTIITNGYTEGGSGLSDTQGAAILLGGLQGGGITSHSRDIQANYGIGGVITSQNGFGSVVAAAGGSVESTIGAHGKWISTTNAGQGGDELGFHWVGPDVRGDWNGLDGRAQWLMTGLETRARFGRASTQPFAMDFPRGAFIGGPASGRWLGACSAMPTTGAFAAGDRCLNTAPRVMGASGSRYTITGWLRIATGSGNVLNIDWVQMRAPTGT